MTAYSSTYDLFLGATESFCHLCKDRSRLIPAHFVTKGGAVYLRKWCPNCGESFALVSTDLDYFRQCESYLKNPDLPEVYLTPIKRGCPFDCGVCPQHQNHPCLALFNIIDECNMKCNICYHQSEPGSGNYRSMEEIEKMHETLLRVESQPDLIQVTGGEPSIHPQIIEILRYLKSGPVRHLMINTNGIRISQDEDFVKDLKSIGRGFEVYLQFDSLEESSLRTIRNADMRRVREQALQMLEKYSISTTLVCVIQKGVNDQEIPRLIEYAQQWKCVRGIVFQPIQDVGRRVETSGNPPVKGGDWSEAEGGGLVSEVRQTPQPPLTGAGFSLTRGLETAHPLNSPILVGETKQNDFRITLSEIREIIIRDERNPFSAEDMIPLPCDPHKISVGYAIKSGGRILPVTGKIPREMIIKERGTIAFEQDRDFIREVIETVSLDTAFGENIISKESVKRKLFCCWPDFIAPENMGYENVFRIVIMEFTDFYNFDSSNIKRECNFMIEPDRSIPFSTYNMELPRSSPSPHEVQRRVEKWKDQKK